MHEGASFSAVQTRGLSLELIRRRLENRGHRVSVATLSYWHAGRRLPAPRVPPGADAVEDILVVPRCPRLAAIQTMHPARALLPEVRKYEFAFRAMATIAESATSHHEEYRALRTHAAESRTAKSLTSTCVPGDELRAVAPRA